MISPTSLSSSSTHSPRPRATVMTGSSVFSGAPLMAATGLSSQATIAQSNHGEPLGLQPRSVPE